MCDRILVPIIEPATFERVTNDMRIAQTNSGDISTSLSANQQSGIGRDLSLHAYDKYTQLKSTYIELS